ncbi:MAG TPA: tRNA (guanosine(37)-N1)-methyltransferase TrmD [Rhodospirillales bacterium]|nr:tRNA (guanosine(37)-N1)-methyltransferase TrmD [Rhodospirillales bacterium]
MTGAAPWKATVLTLFEEMFPGSLGLSLAGQGLKDGIWALETVDIREFASDKHRTVDDAPFGGGPGMVMRADIVGAAIEKVRAETPERPLIYLSPRGSRLDQKRVRELATGPGLTLLCGRYEGVDERVLEVHEIEEVSLGDFVLSGGEPAAIAMIDACVRLLPGIMGAQASGIEESFERGLLEYPHYTRPQAWRGKTVPEVLLSGHHEKIRDWRKTQSEEMTKQRRPDLWDRYVKKD